MQPFKYDCFQMKIKSVHNRLSIIIHYKLNINYNIFQAYIVLAVTIHSC